MVSILGINLSQFEQTEILKQVADFLSGSSQHYIVTPNPEIILASHKDEELFYILNKADLSLADGFGLVIAARVFGTNLPRVTGSDLTVELLKASAEKKTRVIILNWEKGLSKNEDIESALNKQFNGLIFSVIYIGREKFLSDDIIKKINDFSPALLFNTLGSPYQEKLIYHNLSKLPSVKVALGIGGSFDFITKKIKRAPQIFRKLGLEWLWRLLNAFAYQDSGRRIYRIYQATCVFMLKVLKARFINPWLYRSNVACLLYKKEGVNIKFLMVEREDQFSHWQIPQGGTDGESLEVAGTRELREEIGTDELRTLATFSNVYRYKFPPENNSKQSRQYAHNYRGQKQGLLIAEFTGNDSDIKINFWDHKNWKWVELSDFIKTAHPVRRIAYEKFLEKFNSLNIN